MEINLRSSNIIYRACSLPMDISNNEMVKIVLHTATEVVNYEYIMIFVSTSRWDMNQELETLVETQIFSRVNGSILDIKEEVLP